MKIDNEFEETKRRIFSLEQSIKGIKEEDNFRGIKIWLVGDSEPIELEMGGKEVGAAILELKGKIENGDDIIKLKDFYILLDRISCFKEIK